MILGPEDPYLRPERIAARRGYADAWLEVTRRILAHRLPIGATPDDLDDPDDLAEAADDDDR